MKPFIELVLRHRKITLAAWALLTIAAAIGAMRLQGVLRGSSDTIPGSASVRTAEAIDRHFPVGTAFTLPVVMHSASVSVADPAFAQGVKRLVDTLLARRLVNNAIHPWNSHEPALIGRDNRTIMLLLRPAATSYAATELLIDDIKAAVACATAGTSFSATVVGTPALYHEMNTSSSEDLLRAEKWGIPLTLLILLVVFRSPVAAGLPLMLSMTAVFCAMAALFLLSLSRPVGVFAQNAVSMIGLGVGVDYALFIISRYRSEMRAGRTVSEATLIAACKAGHAVLFSGITVAIGFLALFLTRAPFLHTIALGGVTVVTVAVAASLTLLPVALALLGERVNWPFVDIRTAPPTASSWWDRWVAAVTAKPAIFTICGILLLLLMIAPTSRMKLWNIGADDLDRHSPLRQGYGVMTEQCAAGWMGPIVLLVTSENTGGILKPGALSSISKLVGDLQADPRVSAVLGFPALIQMLTAQVGTLPGDASVVADPAAIRPQGMGSVVSADGRAALITIITHKGPEAREVIQWVGDLRKDNFAGLRDAGLHVQVGGVTAMVSDFDQEMLASLRRIIPAVMLVTFLSLMVMFRSVLIPLKATLLNLMSVLASYGFLVAVFQYGVGAGLLGIDPPGGLSSFLVLMLFPLLFGLSMDYEVFLLSSISEHYREGLDNTAAVAAGMRDTAGIITSAALIMVSLFGSFCLTKLTATREFGLGLAFAVLVDATIIRVILVPALMVLMGRANWWLPLRLGVQHRGA